MKKQHILLALAALFIVGTAGQANAQSKIITLDRMTWSRGISSYGAGVLDSTRISIPAAAAAADMADTTAWLDLGQYKFNQTYSGQPLVAFQVTKQLTTSTDSIGCQLQYTNDLGAAKYGTNAAIGLPVTTFYFTTVAAATAGVSAGADGLVGTVVAVSPSTMASGVAGTAATLPYRFVRVVIYNADTSGATGRSYFSVRPVIYGSY